MGITGFGPPLMRRWRRQPGSEPDDEFIARCLELWDRGMDTKDIADVVWQDECVAERAVRLGRERRRAREEQE